MSGLHYFHCVSEDDWAIVCAKDKREARKIVRERFEWDQEIEPVDWEIERLSGISPGETGVVTLGNND